MAKVKGKIAAKVKKSNKKAPVKAGSTMPRNVGGILNARVIAKTKKKKNNG